MQRSVNFCLLVNISRCYWQKRRENVCQSLNIEAPENVVRGHPPASRQTLPLQTGETKDGGRWWVTSCSVRLIIVINFQFKRSKNINSLFIKISSTSGKDSEAGVDTMFSTTEIKSSTLAQTEPIYAGLYYTAGWPPVRLAGWLLVLFCRIVEWDPWRDPPHHAAPPGGVVVVCCVLPSVVSGLT